MDEGEQLGDVGMGRKPRRAAARLAETKPSRREAGVADEVRLALEKGSCRWTVESLDLAIDG